MADDSVLAAVKYAPLAYLTPENQAAQKCLTSLGDRNANLPNLVLNTQQLPRSNHAARAKYRFVLSFDNPGHSRDGSWTLGKGANPSSVDLQVCPRTSRHLTGPALCTISIHPWSGAFLLQNNSQVHSIEYLEADIILGYRESHVLFMTKNHLRFGPLDYVFEINAKNEAAFVSAQREYRREYMSHTAGVDDLLCRLLNPVPKPTQVLLGDAIIHQTVANGAFGIVRIGVHRRSGEVVACKTVQCWRSNIPTMRREVVLALQSK